MISTAPLYSGVHNWTSTERIRMCGLNEERGGAWEARWAQEGQEVIEGCGEAAGMEMVLAWLILIRLRTVALQSVHQPRALT